MLDGSEQLRRRRKAMRKPHMERSLEIVMRKDMFGTCGRISVRFMRKQLRGRRGDERTSQTRKCQSGFLLSGPSMLTRDPASARKPSRSPVLRCVTERCKHPAGGDLRATQSDLLLPQEEARLSASVITPAADLKSAARSLRRLRWVYRG
ncbi:hypothetical protein ROHU_008602 [Labeo rohita]|uniref:Uncharacterized protein n=1 Tax=Labeo rohita TaxID=84645 RepID=A0A498M5P7_LABRO|nr:hypothetical protein ROHU_008602 [Labeo rohita]